jgi:hypothetical protein
VKETLVIGPATAATTKTKDEADALIRDDKLTVRRNRDCKCGGYGHNQRTCLQKSARKVDAVQQKSPKKHLRRTSSAQ